MIDRAPWWKTGVIYQIYPRSFMDANRDGIGDLDGITSKLGYLAGTLGIDAIWISPFFTSPMDDFGYDVADYTDVDPIFGDLAAFDRLVEAAHDRKLAVVIDWVPNHSSSSHPWFVESRSSRNNPKRDWYTWQDPAPDGGPPNNWLAVFGGSSWTLDSTTGQYYLHSFLAQQPDLNWRNPEVTTAMLDTLRFWLDRGVDGFRIDVAHFIMKDPELRDNPVLEAATAGHRDMGDYDRLDHLYDKGHPDNHALFRQIRSILDGYERETGAARYSVGEIHISDWDEWATYYGRDDELHMPYNFAFINGPWTAEWVRGVIEQVERVVPAGSWPNYVLGNHDEHRIASRLGWERSALATLMLLTLRGTPTLYYGDEIGMLQAAIPEDDQQDPWGLRVPGMGRDGCRTPMQWDASPHAGFCTETPWLRVADSDRTRNVAAQIDDPGSRLSFVRRVLAARRSSSALQLGDLRLHDDVPAGVVGYDRTDSGGRLTVVLNFGETPVELDGIEGEIVVGTDPARIGVLEPPIRLAPHEGLVIRT